MEWTPEYSVNNDILDDQHKKLFRIFGKLSGALKSGQIGISVPLGIELETYTLFHFNAEEHEMEKQKYPQLDQHRKEHEKFKEYLREFKDKTAAHDAGALKELEDFLENWFKKHVLVFDKKYVSYL